jgi:hypothetical protein
MSVSPFDIRTVLLAKHAQHVVLVHFPIALFATTGTVEIKASSRLKYATCVCGAIPRNPCRNTACRSKRSRCCLWG